jgi:cobalt-zinc-cadmium efflux system outer membrane protein
VIKRFLLVLLSASSALMASAQDDPAVMEPASSTGLGLAQVLSRVRESSPRTLAELARVAEAQAAVKGSKILPNPSLNYMGNYLVQGANTGSQYFHQLMLDQPLPMWGQRSARIQAAKRDLDAARLHTAATVVELLAASQRAFYDLLAAQQRLGLLHQFELDLAQVEEIVKGRQKGGVASAYDVLRVSIEHRALLADIKTTEADITQAASALAVFLGEPGLRVRARGSLGPEDLPSEFESLWKSFASRKAALAAARADVRTAEAQTLVARRQALPAPNVQAGGIVTTNMQSSMVYVGMGLPLPIFNRGQGTIAQAEARAAQLRRESTAAELETKVALQQALALLDERRTALATYEQEVAGQIVELRRMTQTAYAGSQITLIELLDALRTQRDMHLTELNLQAQAKQAEVEVLAAAGMIR